MHLEASNSGFSTCGAVLEGEPLEGRDVGGLGDDLCVVGYGSGHRVTDDHNQLHILRHGMHSCWCFHGNKVARSLLHHYLAVQGFRHHAPERTGEKNVLISIEGSDSGELGASTVCPAG